MSDNDAGSDPAASHRPRRGMPRWARVILWLVVIALAVVVLFTTVFPWVEERMQDPTMGALLVSWRLHG